MSYDATAQRLARDFGVDLKRLAPVDEGDWCEHCHKPAATVQDTDEGLRYCDAQCAYDYAVNSAEAADQRAIERHFGG